MIVMSKILLVEDNEGDIELIKIAFEDNNLPYTIENAYNGEEALNLLKAMDIENKLPDLIMLDLNMPKMDGKTFLKELEHLPHLHLIPVIVYTSSSASKDITESYELNANCYINKPTNIEEIENVIHTINKFWLETAVLPKS